MWGQQVVKCFSPSQWTFVAPFSFPLNSCVYSPKAGLLKSHVHTKTIT